MAKKKLYRIECTETVFYTALVSATSPTNAMAKVRQGDEHVIWGDPYDSENFEALSAEPVEQETK